MYLYEHKMLLILIQGQKHNCDVILVLIRVKRPLKIQKTHW